MLRLGPGILFCVLLLGLSAVHYPWYAQLGAAPRLALAGVLGVTAARVQLWICCWYELDLHLLLRAWTHTAGPGLALLAVVLLGVAVVGAGKELHAAGHPSTTWEGPCLVVALLLCSSSTLLLVACACLRQCCMFGWNGTLHAEHTQHSEDMCTPAGRVDSTISCSLHCGVKSSAQEQWCACVCVLLSLQLAGERFR